jgi:hypothetical protein
MPSCHFSGFPSRRLLVQCGSGNKVGLGGVAIATKQMSGAPIVNGIIYLVGLVVVVMAILSFLGMH